MATPISATADRVQNPDGSFTVTTSRGPRWFESAGVWVPVDIENSKQVGTEITFGKMPAGVTVKFDTATLTYTLTRPNGEWVRYEGPAATFVNVDGCFVNYVLANGAKFRFCVNRNGVQALTTVAVASDIPPVWTMDWDAKLEPEVDKTGMLAYVFKRGDGSASFMLNQPMLFPGVKPDTAKTRQGDVLLNAQTGALVVTLSEAGYTKPFVIDPTSTFNPNDQNGRVGAGTAATWAAVHDAATGDFLNITESTGVAVNAKLEAGPLYSINRGFFVFANAGAIAANATISSGSFAVNIASSAGNDDASTLILVSSTQADPALLATADYDAVGTTTFGSVALSAITPPETKTLVLAAAGVTHAQDSIASGNFLFALRNSRDTTNIAPTVGQNHIAFLPDNGTTPPVLSLTYTLPSSSGRYAIGSGANPMGSALILP